MNEKHRIFLILWFNVYGLATYCITCNFSL